MLSKEEFLKQYEKGNFLSDTTPEKPDGWKEPFMKAIPAYNEKERLKRLWYLKLMDTPAPKSIKKILQIMNHIFKPHTSLISIIDKDIQKMCFSEGFPVIIDRTMTMCSHVILKPEKKVFIVKDIQKDWRFALNPEIANYNAGFYAGTPLVVEYKDTSFAIGTLCMFSSEASDLSDEEKETLISMSELVVDQINLLLETRQLEEAKSKLASLSNFSKRALDYPDVDLFACETIKSILIVSNVYIVENKPTNIKGTNLVWASGEETCTFSGNLGSSGIVTAIYNDIHQVDVRGYIVVYTCQEKRIFDDFDVDYIKNFGIVLTCFAQQKLVSLANSAKTHFMSGISHELRTPLCGVLTVSELLLEADLSSSQKSLVEIIQSSGKNLIGVVNNLLDFSKNELIDIEILMTKVNLLQFIQENLDTFNYSLPDGVELICTTFNCNVEILVDQINVKLVIQNLLSNAIKFTTSGTVTLRVDRQKDLLVFQIIDTGCGISDGFKDQLFLPFHKENEFSQGTGIGLSLCKKITKVLKGSIYLKRTSPLGSVFQFEISISSTPLPLVQTNWKYSWLTPNTAFTKNIDNQLEQYMNRTLVQKVVILIEDSSSLLYPIMFDLEKYYVIFCTIPRIVLVNQVIHKRKNVILCTKPITGDRLDALKNQVHSLFLDRRNIPEITKVVRVLVIDDSSTNRTILSMFLRKRNIYHELASDGDEGVEKFKKGNFNLVMTDMQMPRMNGLETIEHIRKHEKEEKLTPAFIIMLTGLGTDHDRSISYKAGADSFYVKPFTLKQIDNVINQVFG